MSKVIPFPGSDTGRAILTIELTGNDIALLESLASEESDIEEVVREYGDPNFRCTAADVAAVIVSCALLDMPRCSREVQHDFHK